MKEKEGDYLVQVLDARNGNELGKLLIETGKGSFRLSSVMAAGDWVVVADTRNRVLVYCSYLAERFSLMPQRGYGLQPRVAASATLGT